MHAQPLDASALTLAIIHQEQKTLKARWRNLRTALSSILEAPECSSSEHTDADHSKAGQASIRRHRESFGAERADPPSFSPSHPLYLFPSLSLSSLPSLSFTF